MKPAYLFCFAFAVMLLYNSCEVCSCKKIPCPGFENTNFSSWFPYSSAQAIPFSNNAGNTDTIEFLSVATSSPYEANKGCYNSSSGCTIDANIYGTAKLSNSNIRIFFWGETPFESSNQAKRIDMQFGNFTLQASDINSQGLQNIFPPNYTATFYPQLTLNNISFTNVQLIKKDTFSAKEQGIYKLYLSQGQGIIGYEQYPSTTTWIKQ